MQMDTFLRMDGRQGGTYHCGQRYQFQITKFAIASGCARMSQEEQSKSTGPSCIE